MGTPKDAAAPMSYTGSARRIHYYVSNPYAWWTVGMVLVVLAWALVSCWYLMFGLLLVPYRLVRRGSRRRKIAEKRHQELLDRMGGGSSPKSTR